MLLFLGLASVLFSRHGTTHASGTKMDDIDLLRLMMAFPGGSDGKESGNAGDLGSMPRLKIPPAEEPTHLQLKKRKIPHTAMKTQCHQIN